VARQTPPGAKPNRDDVVRASVPAFSGPVIRVGCRRQRASVVPDEWLPRSGFRAGAIQNPAYRPTGKFPSFSTLQTAVFEIAYLFEYLF
jgi:c-di-GMP-binding flagellar brake protein YcgR